ncbi:MAG: hypothetical protein K8R58_12925 [Bacteroidales bacterium]|nr:hypothetical protein [Bacteroidales bacterium]
MSENNPTNSTIKPKKAEKKSNLKLHIIIIILLILLIIFLGWYFFNTKGKMKNLIDEKEQQKIELQSELQTLLYQHDSIKVKYGTLSDSLSIKDSIIQVNAKEIKGLLNYKWEYRKVKKKLTLLRKITQGYVHQIDSLFVVNKVLKDENIKIKQEYQMEQKKTTELKKDKEKLIEKVTLASLLKAYNVTATGIRMTGSGKEKETDKATKIEKVKVCFMLGESTLVPAGIKTIYIRIARPDNIIVTQKIGDVYTFEYDGKKIQYTTKKEIDYQNESINLCMYWRKRNKKEPAMIGKYNVSVFADGYEIGQAFFELR